MKYIESSILDLNVTMNVAWYTTYFQRNRIEFKMLLVLHRIINSVGT